MVTPNDRGNALRRAGAPHYSDRAPMADSAFNLYSLLPQRGPLEGFKNAASDPAAFSAAFILGNHLLWSSSVLVGAMPMGAGLLKDTADS